MTSQAIKTSQERIKEAKEVINLFDTCKAKLYWLKVLVNEGELSKAEAGNIIFTMGI